MPRYISDIAFTPAVKAEQEKRGSRDTLSRLEQSGRWTNQIPPDLAGFLAARDSFYLATSNGDGQPYIQHRGGPEGFIVVLDERRFGFADFTGNQRWFGLSEQDRGVS
jgi:predicted pyridoxine 5'-phosphate oxidase superfamily flavin-nucleotide-binding protein